MLAFTILFTGPAAGATPTQAAPPSADATPPPAALAVAAAYLQGRSAAVRSAACRRALAALMVPGSDVLAHERLIATGKVAYWRACGERPLAVRTQVTVGEACANDARTTVTVDAYVYTTTTLRNGRGQTRLEGEGIRHRVVLTVGAGRWLVAGDDYIDTAELAYLNRAGASAAALRRCARRLAESAGSAPFAAGVAVVPPQPVRAPITPRYVTYLTYNRAAVVAYADRWTSESDVTGISHYGAKYNPAYYDYASNGGPGDCTPYASQCIFAGGYPYLVNWYYDQNPFRASPSWYNNNPQRTYLTGKYFSRVASVTELEEGDIIYYDWNGDGYLDHTAVYVGVFNGVRCIDAHTSDHRHHAWNLGAARTYFFHVRDTVVWPVPNQ